MAKKNFYSYDEAQLAVQRLNIVSSRLYHSQRLSDERLPSSPNLYYKKEWVDWPNFLRPDEVRKIKSFDECKKLVRELGIKSKNDYLETRRAEGLSQLPHEPQRDFAHCWDGWGAFLGIPSKKQYYFRNIAGAQCRARGLRIKTKAEYRARYQESPLLPPEPETYYSDWTGWDNFLSSGIYEHLVQAKEATRHLNIRTAHEYSNKFIEDEKLPRHPNVFYKSEWEGWKSFLGNEVTPDYYRNLAEARSAVHALRIKNLEEYRVRYIEDPRLPASIRNFFSDEWKQLASTKHFFVPDHFPDLDTLKYAARVLSITNSREYREMRKEFPQLPSHPKRHFKEWVDWYEFLNIPRLVPFEKARQISKAEKVETIAAYQKLVRSKRYPGLPMNPEEAYADSWIHSYHFFDKSPPFQFRFNPPSHGAWTVAFEDFMKTARGGKTKVIDLCQFLRDYIVTYGLPATPREYVTTTNVVVGPFIELLNKKTVARKKKWLYTVKEFFDWYISEHLEVENEDTGVIERLNGAENPFRNFNFNNEPVQRSRNETVRNVLPYHFVYKARNWIFPQTSVLSSLNYSDLTHLHKFDADWYELSPETQVDESDPDCVIAYRNGKNYIFVPMAWTYTYALLQLPARGIQVVFSDSGEGDDELLVLEEGKFQWISNPSLTKGLTKEQSFIKKYEDGEFGVHYTSNKTDFSGKGYSAPFMPEELAYWIIKLRRWQKKYNFQPKPMPWIELPNSNLNEKQLREKGSNFFLFRDYGLSYPRSFQGRIASRLAASLFYSCADSEKLATYDGRTYQELRRDEVALFNLSNLNKFESKFTAHSTRASLITAYVNEFRIPIEVIQKLVGHSSILMTIYYIKSDVILGKLRERMNDGHKLAMQNEVETLQEHIENQRIEELKGQLTANDIDIFNKIDNSSLSSMLFKDIGLCPVAGQKCDRGGESKSSIPQPVRQGFLGEQNCISCKYFLTGPAFLPALIALANEITYKINKQSKKQAALSELEAQHSERIEKLEDEMYTALRENTDSSNLENERKHLKSKLNITRGNLETISKKIDMWLTDINYIFKLTKLCKELLSKSPQENAKDVQLIAMQDTEVLLEFEDVDDFEQILEVCSNADIYSSCDATEATYEQTQKIDTMLQHNGIEPQLFTLNDVEQRQLGRQIVEFLKVRLRSWNKMIELINLKASFQDFDTTLKLRDELKAELSDQKLIATFKSTEL